MNQWMRAFKWLRGFLIALTQSEIFLCIYLLLMEKNSRFNSFSFKFSEIVVKTVEFRVNDFCQLSADWYLLIVDPKFMHCLQWIRVGNLKFNEKRNIFLDCSRIANQISGNTCSKIRWRNWGNHKVCYISHIKRSNWKIVELARKF